MSDRLTSFLAAQCAAAVACRRRPRRHAAHRHRRGGGRLGGCRSAAGRFAQSGADRRRPGGARQGHRAGGQAPRPRGVPRPDERRQARLGGAQRAGGARGFRARDRSARPPQGGTHLRRRQRSVGGHRDGTAELARQRAVQRRGRLADQADQGRLVAGQRGQRPRGVPADRPRGDLPRARRVRPRGAGPPDPVAASGCSRFWPGSSRRASRSRRA